MYGTRIHVYMHIYMQRGAYIWGLLKAASSMLDPELELDLDMLERQLTLS